jgi:hypothetical protein
MLPWGMSERGMTGWNWGSLILRLRTEGLRERHFNRDPRSNALNLCGGLLDRGVGVGLVSR